MQYCMNCQKLDRNMLTRPRNICPKTALNPSAITQFAKEKLASFMEAVLSLTKWFFARDVEVSIIATTEKSIVKSRKGIAKHCIIWMFSVEFVVQFFWECFRTKFFWRSRRTRRSCAIRGQFRAFRYRWGSCLKQCKNGSRRRTNNPNIPNRKDWHLPIIQQI